MAKERQKTFESLPQAFLSLFFPLTGGNSFIDFKGIDMSDNKKVKFGLEIKPETQDKTTDYANLADLLKSEDWDAF